MIHPWYHCDHPIHSGRRTLQLWDSKLGSLCRAAWLDTDLRACLTALLWLLIEPGWADFGERPAYSGAAEPALQQEGSGPAARLIQPSTAAAAAADWGAGEPRSHSPPIDIPASSGGVQAPQSEGEDPALSQYSSFQFWRSPPTMLADDVELGDLREDLGKNLGEDLSSPALVKAHVD